MNPLPETKNFDSTIQLETKFYHARAHHFSFERVNPSEKLEQKYMQCVLVLGTIIIFPFYIAYETCWLMKSFRS